MYLKGAALAMICWAVFVHIKSSHPAWANRIVASQELYELHKAMNFGTTFKYPM